MADDEETQEDGTRELRLPEQVVAMLTALKPQHRDFVLAVVKLRFRDNARAYRVAYPHVTDPLVAASAAYRLSNRPYVAAVLDAIKADIGRRATGRYAVTADRIARELAIIGFSDAADYVIDGGGHVRLAPDAPPEASRALSSKKRRVRYDEDGNETVTAEFTLWSKPAALKTLAEMEGLLKNRLPVDATLTLSPDEATQKLLALLARAAPRALPPDSP